MRTIGWKEKVDFLDFQLYSIPAKVDTGAKTSVLHCAQIEVKKDGEKHYVCFVPLGTEQGNRKSFTLPIHKERTVKNSFGLEETRITIKTRVRLFNEIFSLEISLRDRSNMEFPMLIGRNMIRKRFVVDVSQAYIASPALD